MFGLLIMVSCHSEKRENEERKPPVRKVSMEEIELGIKGYIQRKTKAEGGFFHVKQEDKELRMKLVRVHTEYLSNLGPKSHFACVDLADVSGDVYDVDFFLEGDPGHMDVTETSVHKLNGKPYYLWKQRKDNTWHKVPVEGASSALLGVVEGKDEFEFKYQATLPDMNATSGMWIPIAKSDDYQSVTLVSLKAPGKQHMLEDEVNGNKILYLELTPEESGAEIELVYNVVRLEKRPYADEQSSALQYLKPNMLMPVGGRFREIAEKAIGEKRKDTRLMQARALYDYVIDNMRYIKNGNYGHGDAAYACDTRSGNCSEFHSFFISLARSVGIPARFAIGAAIPSDRNDGGIEGYHCWAEFYAEGKWWPVDISEANKYTALATYYFGRHPANRIELSRGRDLHVTPAPASGPINFLAYPLLEIGGKPAVAKTKFSFTRKVESAKVKSISYLDN